MTRKQGITIVILLIVGIYVAWMIMGLAAWSELASERDRTEKDFETDAERIKWLGQFLPVPIPADAANIRFEYLGWLDWSLKASFRLPAESFEAFSKSVAQLKPTRDGRLSFAIHEKNLVGSISLTPKGRLVEFGCGEAYPPLTSTPTSLPASAPAEKAAVVDEPDADAHVD